MKLEQIRKKINKIDHEIIHLLASRQACSFAVGKYKKKNGLKIYQPKREQEMLVKNSKLAKKFNVDQNLVTKIFRLIVKDSRNIQKGI